MNHILSCPTLASLYQNFEDHCNVNFKLFLNPQSPYLKIDSVMHFILTIAYIDFEVKQTCPLNENLIYSRFERFSANAKKALNSC